MKTDEARKADAEAIRKHYGKTTTEEQLAKAKAQRAAKAQHSPDRDTRIVARMTELRSHADKLAEALRELIDSTPYSGTIKAREALSAYEAGRA